MRITAILLFFLTLTGCQQSAPLISTINPVSDFRDIDLRPYTKKGFLITPGEYHGNFEAIGIINYSLWPGAKRRIINITAGPVAKDWEVENVKIDEVLDRAYKEATALGADAITHFDVRSITRTIEGATLTGVEISGFAIKRKQ